MGRFSFHQNPGSCRLLNFWELPVANRPAFSKISIKEDNLAWYTQIFEKFSRKVFFRATLHVKISRNFGWVVRISEIQPFPGFLKLFREISVSFAAVSKVSKVLVEWKAPMVYACCTVFPGHFLREKPLCYHLILPAFWAEKSSFANDSVRPSKSKLFFGILTAYF